MRDGTHGAPVNPLRRRLQPLRRNSNPPLRETGVRKAESRFLIPAQAGIQRPGTPLLDAREAKKCALFLSKAESRAIE
jgi:hypothetical protein